jgi:hypothetical protein
MKIEEVKGNVKRLKVCANCKHVRHITVNHTSTPLRDYHTCVRTAAGADHTDPDAFCSEFEHMEMIEKCSNCRHWDWQMSDGSGEFGDCRRHPPVMLIPGGGTHPQPFFSETLASDSCGEFKASCRAIAALAEGH